MRTYVRMMGVTAAAVAAAVAMGSPAFAKGYEHETDITAESGDGGDGGEAANNLSCLINLPIISPNSDQTCKSTADGGQSEAAAAVGNEG